MELSNSEVQHIKELNDILLDDAYDRDLDFFSKNVMNLDTVYVLPEDFHDSLEKPVTITFQFSTLIFDISRKILEVSKLFCLL